MSTCFLTTTLAELKKANACASGYQKLKEHLGPKWKATSPIEFTTILESNGLADCLWAFRTLEDQKQADRIRRLFAADCAERVLPIFEKKYPEDKRPRAAIQIARSFAYGLATDEDRRAAYADAYAAAAAAYADAAYAAYAAAADAAYADAYAAAAADAAYADAEREWQKNRLIEYLTQPELSALKQEVAAQ